MSDLDLAMEQSRRPMAWVVDWMQRTRQPARDDLTGRQAAEVDLLMAARRVERCEECAVVLDPDFVAGNNGATLRRPRRRCVQHQEGVQ